jgi:hypothetical protein
MPGRRHEHVACRMFIHASGHFAKAVRAQRNHALRRVAATTRRGGGRQSARWRGDSRRSPGVPNRATTCRSATARSGGRRSGCHAAPETCVRSRCVAPRSTEPGFVSSLTIHEELIRSIISSLPRSAREVPEKYPSVTPGAEDPPGTPPPGKGGFHGESGSPCASAVRRTHQTEWASDRLDTRCVELSSMF